MSHSTFNTTVTDTLNAPWKSPVRLLHWLTAISLAGAAFLTSHGDIGHTTLGWLALGALLIQQFGLSKTYASGPITLLITAGVVVLNLSGLLAPQDTLHLGATLVALVIAALYCATILFEALQCIAGHNYHQGIRIVYTTTPSHHCHDKESIAAARINRKVSAILPGA